MHFLAVWCLRAGCRLPTYRSRTVKGRSKVVAIHLVLPRTTESYSIWVPRTQMGPLVLVGISTLF